MEKYFLSAPSFFSIETELLGSYQLLRYKKKHRFYGCEMHFLFLRGGTLQAPESAKGEIYT